ncbi:hypothetical protein JCM31271_06250 [Halorubrum trueperi]
MAPLVRRYHRIERRAAWLIALAAAGAFLVAYAALSLWPALGVALVIVARIPLFRRRGTTRLRTELSPEDVVSAFVSATPPILAFQWGVADEIRPDDGDGATYEFSYLFGLRSTAIDLDVDVVEGTAENGDQAVDDDPFAVIELEASAEGRPWGAYTVTIRDAAAADADRVEGNSDRHSAVRPGGTVVDVELEPTRRFDLRRIPQGLVAERYYADALAAQGYEVVARESAHVR